MRNKKNHLEVIKLSSSIKIEIELKLIRCNNSLIIHCDILVLSIKVFILRFKHEFFLF